MELENEALRYWLILLRLPFHLEANASATSRLTIASEGSTNFRRVLWYVHRSLIISRHQRDIETKFLSPWTMLQSLLCKIGTAYPNAAYNLRA